MLVVFYTPRGYCDDTQRNELERLSGLDICFFLAWPTKQNAVDPQGVVETFAHKKFVCRVSVGS